MNELQRLILAPHLKQFEIFWVTKQILLENGKIKTKDKNVQDYLDYVFDEPEVEKALTEHIKNLGR